MKSLAFFFSLVVALNGVAICVLDSQVQVKGSSQVLGAPFCLGNQQGSLLSTLPQGQKKVWFSGLFTLYPCHKAHSGRALISPVVLDLLSFSPYLMPIYKVKAAYRI